MVHDVLVDPEPVNVSVSDRRIPRNRIWESIGLLALGAVIIGVYSSYWRPIWFDELLHFAMGGMTFEQALKTIDFTTVEVNHGQTGVYMLVDYFLMQAFGANSVALRLPSLVSGVVLLLAAVTFLRIKGFSARWQALALIALAGHTFLMYFIGEARPYLPLAACALATLVYYQYPLDQRRAWLPRFLGVFGLIFGVLVHPYFIYFVVIIVPFSVWTALRSGEIKWSIRNLLRLANLWLLGSAAVVFLVIGQLTWMRRIAEFGYDPFALMGSASNTVNAFWADHFSGQSNNGLKAAVALSLITLVVLLVRRFRGAAPLLPPLVLLVLALLSSAAVSALSAMRTYWILERQWVAGIALAAVAMVWFFAELHRMARASGSKWLRVPVFFFVILTLVVGARALSTGISTMQDQRAAQVVIAADTRTVEEILTQAKSGDEGAVDAANVNIARGGPVWRELITWYATQAGMRPDFRAKNPSWSVPLFGNTPEESANSFVLTQ